MFFGRRWQSGGDDPTDVRSMINSTAVDDQSSTAAAWSVSVSFVDDADGKTRRHSTRRQRTTQHLPNCRDASDGAPPPQHLAVFRFFPTVPRFTTLLM